MYIFSLALLPLNLRRPHHFDHPDTFGMYQAAMVDDPFDDWYSSHIDPEAGGEYKPGEFNFYVIDHNADSEHPAKAIQIQPGDVDTWVDQRESVRFSDPAEGTCSDLSFRPLHAHQASTS